MVMHAGRVVYETPAAAADAAEIGRHMLGNS